MMLLKILQDEILLRRAELALQLYSLFLTIAHYYSDRYTELRARIQE